MNNKHVFLTFNEWNGELHKSTNLDHCNLSAKDIQNAIYYFIIKRDEILVENKRLQNLVDELLNENKNMRIVIDKNQ